MAEVVEVEPDLVALDAHDVANLCGEPRFAVRGEPHHLVFIAVLRKSEKLRKCRVVEAEGVRKLNAAADIELIASTDAPHHAAEIAEAVDRHDRGFFEWRRKERAGQMRPM